MSPFSTLPITLHGTLPVSAIATPFSKSEPPLRQFSKASLQLTGAYNRWRQKAMELMHIPDPYSFPTGNYLYSAAPFLSILGPTGAI